EKLTTLDGIERECDANMVLVCDGEGPTAIAGIMGGAVSEVSATTTKVLLEVASWNGPNIHKTSQKLALRSEASSRFEKGLSVHLPLEAQQLASRLLVELCGATLMSGTIDVHGDLAQPQPILLRAERVEGLLGVAIPAAECATTLERLDFTVEADGDDLWVTPPHVRMLDVTREADVIEEIARFCVNDLPATLPAARSAVGSLTHGQKLRRRIEDLCSDRGYYEAITYSFTSRELLAKLSPDGSDDYAAALPIANPLSEEHAVMRPLVLPGLLDAAQRNFARGATNVRLFEQGKVYGGTLDAPTENIALGLLISGPATAKTWRTAPTDSDFFVLKALVEAITALAPRSDLGVAPRSDLGASLHPVRQAAIVDGSGVEIGWVGELHPLVARAFDLGQTVVAEINVDALSAQGDATAIFQPFSEFPAVREDLAIVVGEETSAGSVVQAVAEAGGELVTKAELFDVYRGEQVGEGKVSLAIRLEFSALDRTLTDDDVTAARAAITKKLDEIGGSLRA
ncbi:MAG: phenylalanine--tRNA ligase subunit beta, partial [Thermoleophilaceae bacterium]|nr:phenylalanine--tRNA ligase subunit beta [Thermoleophilaceae bacterium]